LSTIAISDDGSLMLATWAAVTEADTCAPVDAGQYGDRCFQAVGTFGSATAILQGSNDGTNWAGLNHAQGTAITGSAAYLKQVVEMPRYMRPSASGGTSQSLTFTLFMRRANTMRT
jgi:hypothetical protein